LPTLQGGQRAGTADRHGMARGRVADASISPAPSRGQNCAPPRL